MEDVDEKKLKAYGSIFSKLGAQLATEAGADTMASMLTVILWNALHKVLKMDVDRAVRYVETVFRDENGDESEGETRAT